MRSSLKGCSFGNYKGKDGVPEDVWGLLKTMEKTPNKPIEYVEEVVDAGLEGRIDLNRNFNLGGYLYTIHQSGEMKKKKNCSKFSYINFSSEGEDTSSGSARQEAGCIDANVVSFDVYNQMKDSFEEIVEDSDLAYAIETIKMLNEDLIVTSGIDIIVTLKRAAASVPQAMQKLAQVCKENAIIGDLVKTILSSGFTVEECFAN